MARTPKESSTAPRMSTRSGDRELRKREKVEYNVVKLSQPPPPPKVIKKKAKVTKKKTKGAKKDPSYYQLVKRALMKVNDRDTVSVPVIMKYIKANYPKKTLARMYVRLALEKGVAEKTIVQQKQSFRLTKSEHEKMTKYWKNKTKKTTTKKSASKKSSTSTKKTKASASKKKPSTGIKKTISKKTSTPKKKTSRDTSLTKKVKKTKTAKNSKETAGEIAGETAAEATGTRGVWQYMDNGWHDYTAEASSIVEGVYQEYKANPGSGLDIRAIKSGHWQYMVDFQRMTQRNITTNTERNIRRA